MWCLSRTPHPHRRLSGQLCRLCQISDRFESPPFSSDRFQRSGRKDIVCQGPSPVVLLPRPPFLSGPFFPPTPPETGFHTQSCVPDVSRPSDRLSPFGPPWPMGRPWAHGPSNPREIPVLAAQHAKTGSMLVPARRHGRGTGSGACSGPISGENQVPGTRPRVRAVWKAACLGSWGLSESANNRRTARPRRTRTPPSGAFSWRRLSGPVRGAMPLAKARPRNANLASRLGGALRRAPPSEDLGSMVGRRPPGNGQGLALLRPTARATLTPPVDDMYAIRRLCTCTV